MENDFRKIDLNLLVVFNALMKDRSVSKTAQRLYLGQPAVSNALARLRDILGDKLFIRSKGGMVPTSRANQLYIQIFPALLSIHSAIFEPQHFDPFTDNRTFTLGMRDWVEVWLMPPLLESLEKLAPQISIRVQVADDSIVQSLFDQNQIDFAITRFTEGPEWLKCYHLATMDYVAVFDPSSLNFGDNISLDEFISIPHLMTSTKGDFLGSVDRYLTQLNKTRNVIYSTSRFNALPHILKQIKAITTIPKLVARSWEDTYNLKLTTLPFQLNSFDLVLLHHEKNTSDQAFIWMKNLIASIVSNFDF